MPLPYKHLFFDLDHTLWDFEVNAQETLHDIYVEHKLQEIGVADFAIFFERYSYHNHRLWDRYTKGFIKQDELRWKRMWFTLLDFKIGNEVLSKKLSVDFLELLPTKKNLFPYTFEILNYATAKGYQLHLITNGFEMVQYNKLKNSALDVYFKQVITSEASNSLKPHKEIFEYAFYKANALPEESVMIGDNEDADIAGGNNAGIDTIFVNHLQVSPTVKATYTITHLQQLEQIL